MIFSIDATIRNYSARPQRRQSGIGGLRIRHVKAMQIQSHGGQKRMNTISVLSNVPKSCGIDSVAIPAAAQSYVQLPNHPCDEVWIGASTNNLSVAGSGSPGSVRLDFGTSGPNSGIAKIPCNGNSSNLWLANSIAHTAQTVGFMFVTFNRTLYASLV